MNTLLTNPIKKTILNILTGSVLCCTSFTSLAQLPGKIHFGLIYPLSTNGSQAPLDTNHLSIHLLAGVSAAERGLAVAGFSNYVRKDVKGTLIAGFINTYGGGSGLSLAGFTNISTKAASGAQFAGFANIGRRFDGAQFAGFMNYAHRISGPQFAGFLNVSHRKVGESQLAGFMNVAGTVEGVQIAGFINIASKVKGAQIAGFINIADSSDYPIGIINIVKNGRKGLGFSIDETQTSMLTFRSGGRVLYGLIGIGYNHQNKDEVYAMEAGLGARFFASPVVNLNAEAVAQTLESFKTGEYFKASFRLMPAVTLFRKLELFGGPAVNFVSTTTQEGKQLHARNLHTWKNKWGRDQQAINLGYTAGLQLLF